MRLSIALLSLDSSGYMLFSGSTSSEQRQWSCPVPGPISQEDGQQRETFLTNGNLSKSARNVIT